MFLLNIGYYNVLLWIILVFILLIDLECFFFYNKKYWLFCVEVYLYVIVYENFIYKGLVYIR